MNRAALLMLLACGEDLAPLHDWPPVGALLDDLILLARGHGGLSDRDATRISTWARRWRALPDPVRELYARNAGDRAIGSALWLVLDGRGRPSGPVRGRLRELWDDMYGGTPPYDLIPRPR